MPAKLKKIELEITSDCNAACPGCARTQRPDLLTIQHFKLEDLKRIFPNKDTIEGVDFKFCGVLGDPAMNDECYEMVEYLVSYGGTCQLSTNGGVQRAEWWHKLGKLSGETSRVNVAFCVDGHEETNHIYRVNTRFDVIARNMEAYSKGGDGKAIASWIFIVFDHNEHELDAAKEYAKDLGFMFATRTGMRNSLDNWTAKLKKRKDGKLIEETKIITTTGNKEHSDKDKVLYIDNIIKKYD